MTGNQAVAFEAAKGLGDHLLADAVDLIPELAEMPGPALQAADEQDTQGTATRIALLERYQDERTIIAGGHFAGAVFGRFLPATRHHRWAERDPRGPLSSA